MVTADPWRCTYCGKRFPVPSLTKEHERRDHREERVA